MADIGRLIVWSRLVSVPSSQKALKLWEVFKPYLVNSLVLSSDFIWPTILYSSFLMNRHSNAVLKYDKLIQIQYFEGTNVSNKSRLKPSSFHLYLVQTTFTVFPTPYRRFKVTTENAPLNFVEQSQQGLCVTFLSSGSVSKLTLQKTSTEKSVFKVCGLQPPVNGCRSSLPKNKQL